MDVRQSLGRKYNMSGLVVRTLRAAVSLEEAEPSAHEHVTYPAYGVPDGECDIWIFASKMVMNLMKGNKLVVVVQSSARSIRRR